MINTIIFDMDGTIIDTEKIKENGWKYAGECIGVKIDDKILKQIRGTNKKYIEELFCKKFKSINFNELYNLREKYIKENIKINGIALKNGLIEVLEFCKNKNYKLAIASSSHKKTIEDYLNKINILSYFDVIIGGDMVNNRKTKSRNLFKSSRKIKCIKTAMYRSRR